MDKFDQLNVIVQVTQLGIIQNFLFYVLSDILELFIMLSTCLQLFEHISQQRESTTVECSLPQSLDEISLARNVEFRSFSCDNEAKQFACRDVKIELSARVTFARHIKQLEGVLT